MRNRYRSARFVTSAHELRQLPAGQVLEAAFAGRSNSGKSSALNAITEHKGLARISKTPGRTQAINVFGVDPERYLIDLPGYGYAKVQESLRQQWARLMEDYLNRRQSLRGLIQLMDVRRPMTQLDRQLLVWAAQRRVPVHVLLTKCDKLGRGAATQSLRRTEEELRPYAASAQLFSAPHGVGLDEVRALLDRWLDAPDTG